VAVNEPAQREARKFCVVRLTSSSLQILIIDQTDAKANADVKNNCSSMLILSYWLN